MALQKRLRRLQSVWIKSPVYFLTICVQGRRPLPRTIGPSPSCAPNSRPLPLDMAGRSADLIAMPDHLHFFCACDETQGSASLSRFIAGFKEWSAKGILRSVGLPPPLLQKQFFDHVLRSDESYESKWIYVRENPVRAGLVCAAEDWPYGGEIAMIVR